jgi:hypothetical protein
MEYVQDKLKEIFDNTVDGGIIYDGTHDSPEYYSLFCKAAANDQLFKLMGNNLCMFNCKYDDADSVMMIFSIPINAKESGAKNIAERVMRVLGEIEECFTTLDFVKSEEVKEEKFVYIVAVKKLRGEE